MKGVVGASIKFHCYNLTSGKMLQYSAGILTPHTTYTMHHHWYYHTDTTKRGRDTGDIIMSQQERGQWIKNSVSKQEEDYVCCNTVPAYTGKLYCKLRAALQCLSPCCNSWSFQEWHLKLCKGIIMLYGIIMTLHVVQLFGSYIGVSVVFVL